MKKITLFILAITLTAAAWAQQLDRSIKPKPGPAPEIKLGKTESFTLPNGLRVFVVENHKLPTISCDIELDIKPELQGDMAGYRDMMPELLVSGTTTRSKDKLNGEIDQMGVNINAGDEGITGSGLKKYQEKILELMADIAMNADIKQEELDKTKKKALSGLETEKNQPDAMVRNVSSVVNFGDHHPYGEVGSEESVKKITLERCTHYYTTYFRPNVAYMAIVGDVTVAEIKPLVEKYFGKWQKKDVPVANYTIPAVSGTKLTKVAFAPRTAAVQSVVSVTYPVDLKPGTEDVIKARVANTVLGGGSQGRLFLDLREKHGWTYGAYSSLREDELGGSFSATVKCRNIVSDSAVGALLDEMRMMQTEVVKDTALQNSITYLSGSFAIGLEDPKRVAQYAINIERYHMPKDFYQNYLKNLSAVTANDVMAMSIKYIRPDHANIVVAGSKDEVANKLAKYSADGKIDYYDYTGKTIIPAETMAAPANMTGDEVYKKYVAAIGGSGAISTLKDLKMTATSEIQGMALTITIMKKNPGMMKETVEANMQGNKMVVQKQVFDGKKGFKEEQGKKSDLTTEEIAETKQESDLQSDLHPEKYGIKRTLKSMEPMKDGNAYVVDAIDGTGKKTTEYYDTKSSLLLKQIEYIKAADGSMFPKTTEFSDYREVTGANGYKIPWAFTIPAGPGTDLNVKVQSVDVNKGIGDGEFN
jgi:zinc protease